MLGVLILLLLIGVAGSILAFTLEIMFLLVLCGVITGIALVLFGLTVYEKR